MTNVKMPEPVVWMISEPDTLYGGVIISYLGKNSINVISSDATSEPLITTTQAQAYADERVREAQQWVSVDDRLPDEDVLVLVYTPKQNGDHDDEGRIDFDYISSDWEGWNYHCERHEHYIVVGGPALGPGPSESAPYTHWTHLPPPPKQSTPA